MCETSRQRAIHKSTAVAVIFLRRQAADAVVGGERLGRIAFGDHHRHLAGREDTVLDGGAAYGER